MAENIDPLQMELDLSIPGEDKAASAAPVEASKVTRYRQLSNSDVAWMNTIKDAETELAAVWKNVKELAPEADQRCLSEAKTCFEHGFHFFVKAIARPEDPFK